MFVKFQLLNSKFCKEVVNCSCPVQHQVACMQQLHSNCHKIPAFSMLRVTPWLVAMPSKNVQQIFEAQQRQLSFQITFSSKCWQFFWIILRNSLAKSPQKSFLVICLTTKLKTWFYEEIQGMCTLNSLMEFISWTKEGPEFITINSKIPCGLTLLLLIYTSKYALKWLLIHSHRFAVYIYTA